MIVQSVSRRRVIAELTRCNVDLTILGQRPSSAECFALFECWAFEDGVCFF